MILGVDVWDGYGHIDYVAAKAAGVTFVISKCSTGNDANKDDRACERNVHDAQAAGLPTGEYLFHYGLRSLDTDPAGRAGKLQAERYWEKSKGRSGELGNFPPIVDAEWPTHFAHEDPKDPKSPLVDLWAQWKTSPNIIVDNLLECLDRLHVLSGRLPIIYTFPDDIVQLSNASGYSDLSKYLLWLASYAKRHAAMWLPEEEAPFPTHAPWKKAIIWQFSADNSPMRIPGIPASPIDRDCIKDMDTLQALLRDSYDAEEFAGPGFDIAHPEPIGDSIPTHEPSE